MGIIFGGIISRSNLLVSVAQVCRGAVKVACSQVSLEIVLCLIHPHYSFATRNLVDVFQMNLYSNTFISSKRRGPDPIRWTRSQ